MTAQQTAAALAELLLKRPALKPEWRAALRQAVQLLSRNGR